MSINNKNIDHKETSFPYINETIEKKDISYSDFELNNMDYLAALKYDNRTFLEIYWSFLKREHLILFTFFSWND